MKLQLIIHQISYYVLMLVVILQSKNHLCLQILALLVNMLKVSQLEIKVKTCTRLYRSSRPVLIPPSCAAFLPITGPFSNSKGHTWSSLGKSQWRTTKRAKSLSLWHEALGRIPSRGNHLTNANWGIFCKTTVLVSLRKCHLWKTKK